MVDIKLYNGNCLEVMKQIPDKSVDLILCDLPYGTTENKWDIVLPFDELWDAYKRIIRKKGNIVLFGTGMFAFRLSLSNENFLDMTWFGKNQNVVLHYRQNICL